MSDTDLKASAFCRAPCKDCSGVCTGKKGHSGKHGCSQGHSWGEEADADSHSNCPTCGNPCVRSNIAGHAHVCKKGHKW